MTTNTDFMKIESVSIDAILTAAMAAMRDLAGTGRDDDYYDLHAASLLDQRPLITVGIIEKGQSYVWAFQPGDQDGADGVITAGVHHFARVGDPLQITANADLVRKDHLLTEIERLASWLWWQETGQHLAAREAGAIR